MGTVVTVFNQKGGVAKTTTAVNLATSLAEQGKKVLMIDIDPQADGTVGFGIDDEALELSIHHLLHDKCEIEDILIKTNFNVDLIPSDISLSDSEISLSTVISREMILSRKIRNIKNDYEYVIVDAPPSLGILSINALAAADFIIVPVSPAFFSMKGIKYLMNTVNLVQTTVNPGLQIMGVLITKFKQRVRLAKNIKDTLTNVFGDKLFKTIIRENSAIEYAQDNLQPINFYDKKSHAYEDYMSLAKEVIEYDTK